MVHQSKRCLAKPAKNYSSFLEHDQIAQAIEEGNRDLAAQCMKQHLHSVYARILASMDEAPLDEG